MPYKYHIDLSQFFTKFNVPRHHCFISWTGKSQWEHQTGRHHITKPQMHHQWLSHIAILYRLIIVGLLLRSNSIEKASYAACSNLSAMHHPTAIQCIITCQCNAHCASSHQGTSEHVMHCTALETNRPMWQLRKSNHVILPTSNICEILLHRNLHQLDSLNQIRVESLTYQN